MTGTLTEVTLGTAVRPQKLKRFLTNIALSRGRARNTKTEVTLRTAARRSTETETDVTMQRGMVMKVMIITGGAT